MLGLAGDDELEDEGEAEQRNRYRPCHHQFCYQRFLDIFFGCVTLKVRKPSIADIIMFLIFIFTIVPVLMWNCENVFNVFNISSVKSRSLHSFPRARHSHRLWFVAVVLFQSRINPKQIVPISIFLKNSFILQHPTQGGVGQLASWKGERDWGRYPASEKWLFAFLARIFFPWEKYLYIFRCFSW